MASTYNNIAECSYLLLSEMRKNLDAFSVFARPGACVDSHATISLSPSPARIGERVRGTEKKDVASRPESLFSSDPRDRLSRSPSLARCRGQLRKKRPTCPPAVISKRKRACDATADSFPRRSRPRRRICRRNSVCPRTTVLPSPPRRPF